MNKTVAQLCDELTQLCHQGYAQVPVTLSIGKNNYGIGIDKVVNYFLKEHIRSLGGIYEYCEEQKR